MSELLFLKTLNNDFVLRGVKSFEHYVETHDVKLNVLISDTGVRVYDSNVLLLNIHVQVKEVM